MGSGRLFIFRGKWHKNQLDKNLVYGYFGGGFKVHEKSINNAINPDYSDGKVVDGFVKLNPTKFKTVFANDILKEARVAWVNYFTKLGYSQDVFHTESLVDIVKAHKSGIKIFPDNIDIVTGGFPCQDFSIAGKRKGFESHKDHNGIVHYDDVAEEETRGKLYTWMKQVVEITKPKIFIAENVKFRK